MKNPLRRSALALASFSLTAALAQAPAPAPGSASAPAEPAADKPAAPTAGTAATAPAASRVEITGGRESDANQRRQSTAAKIVIGREEIEKFGDSTLGEVLRRLPGVTTPGAPGRGGPPRMRGLGAGYTQLLIDGQRMPPGFSLEQLSPEQVERIEILRAPTAETGARAIAGTINIITREGFRRRLNDLRLGFGYENGQFTPGMNWSHNDSAGPLTYTLAASAFRNWRDADLRIETDTEDLASGALLRSQSETVHSEERRRGVNLNSRLQWRLSDRGDMLLLMPSVFHAENHSDRSFALQQSLGATPADYDFGQTAADSRFTSLRLNGQWRQVLGSGPRVELNGGAGSWHSVNSSLRQVFRTGASVPLGLTDDSGDTRERSLNMTFKLSGLLGGGGSGAAAGGNEHSLVAGGEVEAVNRRENRTTLQNGLPQLIDFGDDLEARSLRVAAYLQDEWNLSPNWSVHAGLRWEAIRTRGEATNRPAPENRSSVVTPLLHAVWKPDPKSRDQLRMSLTRSYRSPGLGDLIARPRLSSRFPAGGANDAVNPDRAGNPDLKPELAIGIDLAVERYLPQGGVLSANLFRRNISDLMRTVTALETVSWSPVPRFVARRQNVGDAVTQGIELEAKFRLDQLVTGAPGIELRNNLSFFNSKVAGVNGPDNRLDQQAKMSANAGADWRIRGTPLTIGGNLNWVPGYRTQVADDQAVSVGGKRVYDAYGLWTFNPAVALRLLASNLAAPEYASSLAIDTGGLRETARTYTTTYVNWQLRLELKL